MSRKTRSDKKFLVKVWVPSHNKAIFRSTCMKHHLSMMFVGEVYIMKSLDAFSDERISLMIEERLPVYNNMNKSNMMFEVLGIRITNKYWQQLANYAVTYHTSIAKIGSVLFENAIGEYDFRSVFSDYGLTFSQNKNRSVK